MNDKKKIVIIAALAVVMVGVGAFQFMGSSQPQPVAAVKPEIKATVASTEGSDTQSTAKVEPGASPSSSAAPTSSATPTAVPGAGDPERPGGPVTPGASEGAANAGSIFSDVDPALVAASALPARDPFNGDAWDLEQTPTPVHVPTPTPPKPKPVRTIRPRGPGGNVPMDWKTLTGGGGTALPEVGGPNAGLPSIDEVPYKVHGTVNGSRPAVVISDGAGQRIVRVGSKIDDNTEVIGVSRGKMTVRRYGKVKTISISDGKAEGNN